MAAEDEYSDNNELVEDQWTSDEDATLLELSNGQDTAFRDSRYLASIIARSFPGKSWNNIVQRCYSLRSQLHGPCTWVEAWCAEFDRQDKLAEEQRTTDQDQYFLKLKDDCADLWYCHNKIRSDIARKYPNESVSILNKRYVTAVHKYRPKDLLESASDDDVKASSLADLVQMVPTLKANTGQTAANAPESSSVDHKTGSKSSHSMGDNLHKKTAARKEGGSEMADNSEWENIVKDDESVDESEWERVSD